MNRQATIVRLLPLAALALLPACERSAPAEEDIPATDTAAPATPSASPSQEPAGGPGSDAPPRAADGVIPAALQGRWGLVPADCDPARADAKGLLVIAPRRLEFYESAATLNDIEEAAPARVRAHFAFTGEGMSWGREMTLALEDEGKVLVRQEFGEDAAAEPFRYRKC